MTPDDPGWWLETVERIEMALGLYLAGSQRPDDVKASLPLVRLVIFCNERRRALERTP